MIVDGLIMFGSIIVILELLGLDNLTIVLHILDSHGIWRVTLRYWDSSLIQVSEGVLL